MTTIQMLHCVGCGNAVARSIPGQTLAIACRCGAAAPLLVLGRDGDQMPGIPGSLVVGRAAGHWEYYLGYSDHMSPGKTKWLDALGGMGCTTQAHCEEESCRQRAAMMKEKVKAL